MSKWLANNNSCPLCKAVTTMSSLLIEVTDKVEQPQIADSQSITIENNKVQNLIRIIKASKDDAKILVFSEYEETFVEIVAELHVNDVPFAYLKGTCGSICNTVDKFKKGILKVLLVNSNHYGSGMNLECTTDVIMVHKFDNEMEKQVIGRANRYGRCESLNVWYLLHQNEVDAV
jgi:SNF2 family DNA or RNA helicase